MAQKIVKVKNKYMRLHKLHFATEVQENYKQKFVLFSLDLQNTAKHYCSMVVLAM